MSGKGVFSEVKWCVKRYVTTWLSLGYENNQSSVEVAQTVIKIK